LTETCSAPQAAYPAGDATVAILRSMTPNSRRVRWLSAGVVSGPPGLTGCPRQPINRSCPFDVFRFSNRAPSRVVARQL